MTSGIAPHLFPPQLRGVLIGVLLIVLRKQISTFLEKVYRKFPTNKISSQFYSISYRIRPVFLTILGVIIIGFSVLSYFSTH
jgi:hypothetical protein